MRQVLLDIDPMQMQSYADPDANNADFARCLAAAVHAQAEACLVILEHHPDIRPMYETGIRYVIEPAQPIELKAIPTIASTGGSDCKNLVAWRLAELWREEMRPPPLGYGKRMSHCKVYWKTPVKPQPPFDASAPERRCPVCQQFVPNVPSKVPTGWPVLHRNLHAEIRLPERLPNGTVNPETVEDPSRLLGM